MATPTDRYGNPIDKENLDLYDDEDIYETDEKGFVLLPKKLKPGLNKVYKSPIDQAESLKTPPYNKEAIVRYLKNYGSGFDDDNYEVWAKQKGKQLQGKPLNPEFLKTSFARQWYGDRTETYADQYLNDDEWLQEIWPDVADDALDYQKEIGGK